MDKNMKLKIPSSRDSEIQEDDGGQSSPEIEVLYEATQSTPISQRTTPYLRFNSPFLPQIVPTTKIQTTVLQSPPEQSAGAPKVRKVGNQVVHIYTKDILNAAHVTTSAISSQAKRPEPPRSNTLAQGTPIVTTAQSSVVTTMNLFPAAQVVLLSNPIQNAISSVNPPVPHQQSQGVLTSVTNSNSSIPVIQIPTVIQTSAPQPTVIKTISSTPTVTKVVPLPLNVSQMSSTVIETSQSLPPAIKPSPTLPSVSVAVTPVPCTVTTTQSSSMLSQSTPNLSRTSTIGAPLIPRVPEPPKPRKPRAPRKKYPKKDLNVPLPVTSVPTTPIPVTQPPSMTTSTPAGPRLYRTSMPPLINTGVGIPISMQGFSNLNPAAPGNIQQVQMPFNMNNLMTTPTGLLIQRPIGPFTSQASALSPQNTIQLSSQNQRLISLVRPQNCEVNPPSVITSSSRTPVPGVQYLQQQKPLHVQDTPTKSSSTLTSIYGTNFVKGPEMTSEGVNHLPSMQDSFPTNPMVPLRRQVVSLDQLKSYQAQQLAQNGQLTYHSHASQYPSQIKIQAQVQGAPSESKPFKSSNSPQPLSLQDFIELNSSNRATPMSNSVITTTPTALSSAGSVHMTDSMRPRAPDAAAAARFSDDSNLQTLTFYQTPENRALMPQIMSGQTANVSVPEVSPHGNSNSNMDSIIEEVISRSCRDPDIGEGTVSSMSSSVGTLTPTATPGRKKTPAAPRKRESRAKKKDVQNTSGSTDSVSTTAANSLATPLPSFCSSFQNSSSMFAMEPGPSGAPFPAAAANIIPSGALFSAAAANVIPSGAPFSTATANVIPPGQNNSVSAAATAPLVKPKRKQSVRKKKVPPVVTPIPVAANPYVERPLLSHTSQVSPPSVIQAVPLIPPEVAPPMDLLSQFPANIYLNESSYISDQSLQIPTEVPDNFLDNLEEYFEKNPPEPGFSLDSDLVNLTLDSYALNESFERTQVDTSLPPGASTSLQSQSTTVSPTVPLNPEPAAKPKKPRKPYVRKPYVRKKDRVPVAAVNLNVTSASGASEVSISTQFSSPNLEDTIQRIETSQFSTPEPEQARSGVSKPKRVRKPYVRKKDQVIAVNLNMSSVPTEIAAPLLPETPSPLIPSTIKQRKSTPKKKAVPESSVDLDISAQIAAILADCTSEIPGTSVSITPVAKPKRVNSRKKKEVPPFLNIPPNVLDIHSSTTMTQELSSNNPSSILKVKKSPRSKKEKAEEVSVFSPSGGPVSEADAILAKINLTPHLTAERYIPKSVPGGFMTGSPSYSMPSSSSSLVLSHGNERSSVIQSTFNFQNFSPLGGGITIPPAWNSSWYSTEKPLNHTLPEPPTQTYAPIPASAMKKSPARKRPTKKKSDEVKGQMEAPIAAPAAASCSSTLQLTETAGVAGTSSTIAVTNKPEPISKMAKPKRSRKKEKQNPSLQLQRPSLIDEVPPKLLDFILNTPTSSPMKSKSDNTRPETTCLTSPLKLADRGLITVIPIMISSQDEPSPQLSNVSQFSTAAMASPEAPCLFVSPVKSTANKSEVSTESNMNVVSSSATLANVLSITEKIELKDEKHAEAENEAGLNSEACADTEDESHQSIAFAKPVRRRGRPAKYDDAHYTVRREVNVMKREVQPNAQSEASKSISMLNPGFRWVYTREELEFLYKEGSILINRNDIDFEPHQVTLWNIRDGGRGRVILEEYEPYLKESVNQWYHISKWVQELSDGSTKKWGERTILVENPTALYKAYLPVFVIMYINNPDMSVLKYFREKRTLPYLMDIYQITPDTRSKFEDCLRILILQATDPGFIDAVIHEDTHQESLICQLRESWATMETWIREGCFRILNSPKWRSQFWIQFMKYTKVIYSSKNVDKAQACAACMNSSHVPARVVQFEGPVYDVRSLQAKRDDEWDDSDKPNPDLQLCHGCSTIVKNFHSLYHVRFHMLSTVQYRIDTIINSGIKPELKFCPMNLVDSFMSDKEWLTMSEAHRVQDLSHKSARKATSKPVEKCCEVKRRQLAKYKHTMLVDFQISLSRARKDGEILDKFVPSEGTHSAEISSLRNTSPRGVGRPRKNSRRDSTGAETEGRSDSEMSTVHDPDV